MPLFREDEEHALGVIRVNILVINPNTSKGMTRDIEASVKIGDPGINVTTAAAPFGPVSIESFTDETYASAGVLEILLQNEHRFDAFVIACYSDPGLYAARELTPKPVVGIGESSMLIACSIGWKFSLIGTMERDSANLMHLVNRYGLTERCASVRTTGFKVTDFAEKEHADLLTSIMEAGRKAVTEDHAEVLCLACAGMTGLAQNMQANLGIPVIDPVAAGVQWAILQLRMGLCHAQLKLFEPTGVKGFKAEKDEKHKPGSINVSLTVPGSIYDVNDYKEGEKESP